MGGTGQPQLFHSHKRDLTLDFAKGLLIMLVVLGHGIQYSFGPEWLSSQQFFDDVVFKTIYSFHMPLFMLISGYLFYGSNKKALKPLLLSKLKAIGIPMLCFILLYNAVHYLLLLRHGDVVGIMEHFCYAIFFETAMWFLFSLLLNMVVIALLTRLFKNKRLLYMGMVMLFMASLFVLDTIVLNVYKFMFPFFCLGYVVRQNDVPLYAASHSKMLLGFLTILSILAICWFDYNTYIYTSGFCISSDYTSQFLTDCKRMAIGLVVSYTFMQYVNILAGRANIFVKKTSQLGQMSLFVYGMNMVFNQYWSRLLEKLSFNVEQNYLIPIGITAIFIFFCWCLYRLFERTRFTRVVFLGKP